MLHFDKHSLKGADICTVTFFPSISARRLYFWSIHLHNIWYGDKWGKMKRFAYFCVASLHVVGKFLISTEEKLICYPRKKEWDQWDAYCFISSVLSKQHQLAEDESERGRERERVRQMERDAGFMCCSILKCIMYAFSCTSAAIFSPIFA